LLSSGHCNQKVEVIAALWRPVLDSASNVRVLETANLFAFVSIPTQQDNSAYSERQQTFENVKENKSLVYRG
jgi:hypothetical protein